jgi:hypothetical protein
MSNHCWITVVLTAGLLVGCGGEREAEPVVDGDPTVVSEAKGNLPQPFTAEQIRDEWRPGLTIDLFRITPEEEVAERWTVLFADEEGAEIEYAIVDNTDLISGEPRVEKKSWTELRDHATFPAANAQREEVVRETMLGNREGWLYTVRDEDAGTVTELFFAKELPGAPVHMRTMQGDQVILELYQVARRRQ